MQSCTPGTLVLSEERLGEGDTEIGLVRMHHKRKRAKKQRAGGARHGACKPQKVVGNSEAKINIFGRRRASEVRQILRAHDE